MEVKLKEEKKPAKPKLKSGVKRIMVRSCTTPDYLVGKNDCSPHVVITSMDDGGYVIAEIPEDGYYEGTKESEKRATQWACISVPPGGPCITAKDACEVKGESIKISLSKRICGSALFWLEAFQHAPENKMPFGFFVSGYCKPEITKVSWHKYQVGNKGPEVTGDVKYGDMLQLHIETEGLNGDTLEVNFFSDESDGVLETIVGQTYQGKLIINFPVKTIWRSQLFNAAQRILSYDLNITVKITNERLSPNFEGAKLTIKSEVAERKLDKGSAVPVTIGKVEVDAKKYEMCKYTGITVKTKDREYIIFENGKVKEQIFEIVAGSKQENEVTVLLTDSNTKVCTNKSSHKNRVFTIDIPDVKYERVANSFSDTEANESIKVEKANNRNWDFTGVEGKTESKRTLMANSSTRTSKMSDKEVEDFATVKRSDEELSFNARYNYGDIEGNWGLNIFKYFWPKSVTPQIYNITTETCAYKHKISIATFPDIKWILQFKFNCEENDFNRVKRTDSPVEPTGHEKKNDKITRTSGSTPKKKGNLNGLIEIFKRMEISLAAEWDGGNEKKDLTKDFVENVFNCFQAMSEACQMIAKIIEGEESKTSVSPKDKLSLDAFISKLNRKPQKLEMLYPSLAFAGAWWREEIKDKKLNSVNKQALAIELALSAKPLVGFELKWDILELLCRKHPLAYIALKIVDGLLILLMDKESEIKFDFSVTGKMDIEAKLKHNLLAGNALGNGYSAEKEEEIIAGSNALTVKLEAKLNLSKTKYVFQYGVVTSFEVGAAVEAGLGIKSTFGADMKGIYISRKVFFEGLKLSIYAKGKVYIDQPGGMALEEAAPMPSAQLVEKEEEEMTREELIGAGFEFKGEITFAKYEGTFEKHYFTENENK